MGRKLPDEPSQMSSEAVMQQTVAVSVSPVDRRQETHEEFLFQG